MGGVSFVKGDVVRLRSGGPGMAVDDVREDGFVNCWWFHGDGNLSKDTFEPKSLQLIWPASRRVEFEDGAGSDLDG